MNPVITQIEDVFSATGSLANHVPGYSHREVQQKMAISVAKALDGSQVLIAEAGTGTGKTYAYLIPSLLSGKKVIISTGTKNLQDQLFHRDLPLIRKTLAKPIKVALLKGRGNYICLHRLNTYAQTDFMANESLKSLYKIQRWADTSQDGEIEHISGVKPDSQLLPYITSSADNCLGQDCEFFTKCFLLKARRQAQEADVLIINHHLFFADTQLKEAGISELLPDSHAIIFDEAHQLHETATHFLGESISSRQLTYLARDIQAEQQIDAPDMAELKAQALKLVLATKALMSAFGSVSKGSWEHIVHKPGIKIEVQNVLMILTSLVEILEVGSIRGRGLENCWRRAVDLAEKFKRLTLGFPEDQIHWFEVYENSFSIHHTPINVSGYFQKLIESCQKAWIFTSATLSVNGDFSYFESHLGLFNAEKVHLESPFNYSTQALLYTPVLNALPNEETYVTSMLDCVIPILKLSRGRAFFLFTSHRALKEAASHLAKSVEFPLLIQGSEPKTQLLSDFCELDNAILLGTSSFWEGVDVKGNQLSCVIIDKIPFAAPDDPILKTRFDHYRRAGKNPFMEYQLPQAVIAMRQGAGRLIRDINDKGLLMICDPRITKKEYGKVFLDSLPAMPLTQSYDDVVHFFQDQNI